MERQSDIRHEYLNGEVFAMTSGSLGHNGIVSNLAGIFYNELRGRPCEAFVADLRLRVTATGLYTYPDLVVVCGEPQLADAHLDTLLNPTLIVEVLSPSTEATDRGRKFAHYRTIESLAEVVLVSQERVQGGALLAPTGGWLAPLRGQPAGGPSPAGLDRLRAFPGRRLRRGRWRDRLILTSARASRPRPPAACSRAG